MGWSFILLIYLGLVRGDVPCTATSDPLERDESVTTWEDFCTQNCGGGVRIGLYKCVNSITGDEECSQECEDNGVPVRIFETCNTDKCPPVTIVWDSHLKCTLFHVPCRA